MRIIFHINKRNINHSFNLAIKEYIKRITPYASIEMKFYGTPSKLKKIKYSGYDSYQCIVRIGHDSPSSEEFAEIINGVALRGCSCMEFYISEDPDDIYDRFPDFDIMGNDDDEYLLKLHELNISSISLSVDAMTTALSEQIYRAYTIINNLHYHK